MSRRTATMQQRLVRTRPDLVGQLLDQLAFLRTSAAAFDDGAHSEAKRIAVTARVLLHDTGSSHSLLGQLDLKETIVYYDTAPVIRAENLATTLGLFGISVQSLDPGRVSYRPRLDDFPPLPGAGTWRTFDEWWRRVVTRVASDNFEMTREQYVLEIANTEGGAHVDR